jgi:acyl dehydratase
MDKFYDDFEVGEKFISESAVITDAEIVEFARRYDPQPFHVDIEAAKASPYGGLIASGFHTLSFGFRLFIDTGAITGCSMGSPGAEEIRWLKPVRPGDTLRTEAEVVAKRPSSSDAGRGVLTFSYAIINQREETVASMRGIVLVHRKNEGGSA